MAKDNIFAAVVFVASCVAFVVWGHGYVASQNFLLFLLAGAFGLFMAFNIGGNDVANAFGTSVGAKTITVKQALVIAAVFELSGAVFAGGAVTGTIKSGIIAFPVGKIDPMHLVAVMIAALFSAGTWLFIATKKGLPVSTTHAIIGGIVGGGITMGYMLFDGSAALGLVKWSKIGDIALSWVISPLCGGALAFLVYAYIDKFVLVPSQKLSDELKALRSERKAFKAQMIADIEAKPESEQLAEFKSIVLSYENKSTNPFKDKLSEMKEREKALNPLQFMRRHIPLIAAVSMAIISSSLLTKGLKNLNLGLGSFATLWIVFAICSAAYFVTLAAINIMKQSAPQKQINRIFGWMQLFTASSFAFSHGANDISNAIGPFAAVLDVLRTGSFNAEAPVPTFAMVVFGIALVVGLWFLGKEVMSTVGEKLANIKPSTGFSAELAASAVILVATMLGMPISSTHVLIGAVLGIGLYNKDGNWAMLKPIGLAWIITLPVAVVISSVVYVVLVNLLGV